MKTPFAAIAIAPLVFLVCAAPTFASVEQNDLVTLTRPSSLHGTSGGEFLATVTDNDSNPNDGNEAFNTFCVEINEHISLGGTYRVASVGQTTVATGSTLGSFAAWLYTNYLDNNLGIVVDTDKEANTIQIGIWKSMGYLGTVGNSFNGINSTPIGTNWTSSLLTTFENAYAAAIAGFSWAGGATDNYGNIGSYTGQIQIMNLVTNPGNVNSQDQLFRNPTLPPPGTAPAPEPISLITWSLLTASIVMLGRRSR